MTLTKDEKAICKKYGAYDETGNVHCSDCPLAVDTRLCVCKANCTREEWEEYKDGS